MKPKRPTKTRKWARYMAQSISLEISPNQIVRLIFLGEMTQNNQMIAFFYPVLGHLSSPKWIQKGTKRPTSGRDVSANL
jgi:hypothetical protein